MDKKDVRQFVVGLSLAALGIFFLASLLTHSPNEGPFASFPRSEVIHNACGIVGAYASSYLLLGLGWTSYLVAACLLFMGGVFLGRYRIPQFRLRMAGLACLLISCTLIFAMVSAGPGSSFSAYRPEAGIGGIAGIVMADLLYRSVGITGAALVATVFTLTGTYLITGGHVTRSVEWLRSLVEAVRSIPLPNLKALNIGWNTAESGSASTAATKSRSKSRGRSGSKDDGGKKSGGKKQTGKGRKGTKEEKKTEETKEKKSSARKAMEIITPDKRGGEKEPTRPDLTGGGGSAEGGERWEIPPVDIFTEKASASGESEEAIRQKGVQLEQTLEEFKIDASVERVQQGPVVTMYEIKLAAGTKLSKVRSLSDDLAIALKAPNVRIVAPLPGKSPKGVEVPQSERELVGRQGAKNGGWQKAKKQSIPLFLGKDIGGKPVVMDLATAPHLLIAGATGSGKSVC
ncbi:MAG: DNA translocase FtsK 4TM domain-containing protein, partial [Planctomycetota bacterium]